MKTLSLLSLAAGLAFALTFAFSGQPGDAEAWWAKDCARNSFKTKLVKDACADGGQKAAKKAMKTWVKTVKKAKGGDPDLACDSCHSKLGDGYPLKKTGLATFNKYKSLAK